MHEGIGESSGILNSHSRFLFTIKFGYKYEPIAFAPRSRSKAYLVVDAFLRMER